MLDALVIPLSRQGVFQQALRPAGEDHTHGTGGGRGGGGDRLTILALCCLPSCSKKKGDRGVGRSELVP
jgi:hypothetical protein